MSYSSNVKKEISNIETSDCCSKSELMAIIIFKGEISISRGHFNLLIKTTSLMIARHIVSLFKKVFNINPEILSKEQKKLDYKNIYQIIVRDCNQVLSSMNLMNETYQLDFNFHDEWNMKDCCEISYLRGAFLSRGSINDPTTQNYHLEIVCPNASQASFLKRVLEKVDISSNVITRSKGEVLYLKKAENIGDFLRYVGASNTLFDYEDIRIKKDLNNYVNRITNCDVANEQKAFKAAEEQLSDIKTIFDNVALAKIDERLLGVMILRNRNPDDTLSQLSEKAEEEIGYYISKSGISHRFKEIKTLADEIRKGTKDD